MKRFVSSAERVSVALLLASSLCLHAQQSTLPAAPTPEAAILYGDVIDSHDGLVPGATVTATAIAPPKEPESAGKVATMPAAASTPHTVVSDSSGHFVLRDLPPGIWTVKVSAPDLQSFVDPELVLKPGEHHELQGVVLTIAEQRADVTVTLTIEQIADLEIHDQEQQRSLAIFPNFNTSYVWNAAPMTRKQKFKLSFRSTLDPISFATAAAVSGYQYGTNKYPDYGTGFSGYAKYYGAAWGTGFIGHTISYAVLPSIFGQDPRYFYMGPGSPVKSRIYHAVSSSVLSRGDSGHTQFNVSHIAGNFIAGYISKSYHPGTDKGIGLAVDNMFIGVAGQMGVNLVREFVLRKVSTGTPKYGKGKPAKEALDPSHPIG